MAKNTPLPQPAAGVFDFNEERRIVPQLREILQRLTEPGRYGFLSADDVRDLAVRDRLRLVLVRCNACRMTVAAQDVKHVLAMIEASGQDCARDVSLLASDRAFRGFFEAVTSDPAPEYRPDYRDAPEYLAVQMRADKRGRNAAEFHGWETQRGLQFREEDCGGTFDGFGVTSDADPGL